MKIKSLEINSIKSFKHTNVDMSAYTVFVGENNSGKSNILFSLLWFFGKQKLKTSDIYNKGDSNPYVIVEFELDEGEDAPCPDKYVVDGKIRILATPKTQPSDSGVLPTYQGFTGEDTTNPLGTKFMGFESVATFVFGDVVYIPSIKPLTDEMKFTANSSFNQLVSKYVIARIKGEEDKAGHYQKVVDAIDGLSKFISEGETSALATLKTDISKNMLTYSGISLGFGLQSPEVDELIKNSLDPHVLVASEKLPLSSQGDGFQRSMIFSLLANLAEIIQPSKASKKNECTFYIVEEPELFLHPNHQTYFRNKLEELAIKNTGQVVLTSHSPYFINNIKNYSQIKRVDIHNGISDIKQISDAAVNEVCKQNGELMAKALDACRTIQFTSEELSTISAKIAEEDQLRYLLWIDPNRANAFLSKKVILVEGPTEKALFAHLFNNPEGKFYDRKENAEVAVIDVVGKYHFYKFANLLHAFGIKTWCIYDTDNDKEEKKDISHKLLNQYIKDLKVANVLQDIFAVSPSIEEFIGLEKRRHIPDIALYSNLVDGTAHCKTSTGYLSLCSFVEKILDEEV